MSKSIDRLNETANQRFQLLKQNLQANSTHLPNNKSQKIPIDKINEKFEEAEKSYIATPKLGDSKSELEEGHGIKPSEEGLRALARYKAKKKEIIFRCVDLMEQFDYTDLRIGDIFCSKEKPYKVFVIAEIEKDKLYVKRIDHRHLGEPTGEFMHKVHILGGYYLKLILD